MAYWYPPGTGLAPAPAAPTGGVGAVIAAAVTAVWAVTVTVALQVVGWLIDQVLITTGSAAPGWAYPVGAVANAALVAVPAVLLATLARAPGVRAAGRAWAIAAAALGALGALRGIPLATHEAYLAGLAVLAALAALGLRLAAARRPRTATTTAPDAAPAAGPVAAGGGGAVWLGAAAGLLVLVPWLWVGALGGLTETVFAVFASTAVAWLAATVLDTAFWAPYATLTRPGGRPGRARLVLLGGAVAGVALLLLGAGTGAAGPHLAMLLVLPPLGFAAAALWAVAPRPGPLLALLAPALAGPLALADPEEVTLVLFGRDVPFWVAVAAGASLALALLVGLAYALLVAPRPGPAGRRRTGLLTAAAVAVAATAVYAWPGQPGLHGDRLFVVLRAQADLSAVPADAPPGQAGRDTRVRAVHGLLVAHAERTQAPLRRELDRLRLSYTPYYLVNAVEVAGGPAVRAWLGRRADVDRILPSQRVRPLPAHPGPERGSVPTPAAPPWNITQIGADRVWSEFGIRGAGITVGTSDSGVDGAHPALAGGYRGGDDSWYDPWAGTTTPRDRGGHGTHTLGSAVGAGGIGVAPDAQWVGCVNLDRNLGSPARYLDCLQFMLAPFPRGGDPFADGRPERAPHVLTNSWGCPAVEGCDTSVLGPATAAFAAAGVFFVAAAGNTGPECGSVDDPPAVYPDVLSVGAVDRAGQVVDFSSRGPTPAGAVKPDVAAPGAGILSALPGGGYGELSGTSMAAPHVAGVVALLWSARPALIGDVAKTREVLQTFKTATGTGEALCGKGNTVGTGVVDAYAVVAATRRDG